MSAPASITGSPPASFAAGRHARARRNRRVISVLAVTVCAAFVLHIFWGDEPLAPSVVLGALFGDGDPSALFTVRELRLPRALTGVLVGLAFGLSGALLQQIARNPLASPDLIGISAGASAAAVFAILVMNWGGLTVSVTALIGAMAAAAAIYLLARKNGFSGYRLVLVGIGIGAMANAVISYLLTRSAVRDAQLALGWLVGSLNGRVWTQFIPLAISMAVVLPSVYLLHHRLGPLQLGNDTAAGLGVAIERATFGLLLVAVAAAAVATAASGPLQFVALVAAPIALRLVPGGTAALIPSMLVGAVIVLLSDTIAQHLLPTVNLPAGVVTGAIGAPYLLWLLVRTNRRGRA